MKISIRKLVERQYWAGILAVATLVVMVVFTLPEEGRLSRLRSSAAVLQSELMDRSARLRSSEGGYDETETVRRRLMSFGEAIPNALNMGDFLAEIHGLAEATGLYDHRIVPQAVVDGEDVSWMPLDMNFKGGFEAVYAFLRNIEAQPRVVRVQRMELTTKEQSSTELEASLTLHIYFRRS